MNTLRIPSICITSASLIATLLATLNIAEARPRSQPDQQSPIIYPATASTLQQEIAARKGRVVLVNFWASWCPPCVKEFPALVKLQRRYRSQGLSVLFVSANEPGEQKTKVASFLRRERVRIPTWIVSGDPVEFITRFDPSIKESFALPHTYIYNRKGKLIKIISGEDKTYRQFRKIIKPLL